MIDRAKKRTKFFDKEGKIIRSKQSRVANTQKKSYPIKTAIYCDDDPEFIDFIEVKLIVLLNIYMQKCLEIDPDLRITPEQALKHPWLKRNNVRAMLKDNEDIV